MTIALNNSLVTNTFVGLALGDAIGVGFEFQNASFVRQNLVWGDYQTFRAEPHDKGCARGRYSDDAEQSLAVARLITHHRHSLLQVTPDDLLGFLKDEYDWFAQKNGGCGRGGQGSIEKYFLGERPINDLRQEQAGRALPGNAPVMRAIPFGFLPKDKIDRFAAINAAATHPHPDAVMASRMIAWGAHLLLMEKVAPQDLLVLLAKTLDDPAVTTLLKQANQLDWPLSDEQHPVLCGPQPVPYLLTTGRVMIGIPGEALRTAVASLYIAKHAVSLRQAIEQALFLGGDVDSVASIAGGLVAGMYGLGELQDSVYLEKLENLDHIIQVAQGFEHTL